MSRPTPYAMFMVETATWAQRVLKTKLVMPTLLAAQEWSNFAVICPAKEKELHVLDRKQGKLVRELPIPGDIDKGADFTHWVYSMDGLNVAAYNMKAKAFAAWSLVDGDLLHHSKGMGIIPPEMAFMPGGRLALCDGHSLDVYQLGAQRLYRVPISSDLRSMVIFAPLTPEPTLNIAVVLRKGIGSSQIESLRIEEGEIKVRQEGPIRIRPGNNDDRKSVRLFQFLNIPGSTARILVVLEEEEIEKKAKNTDWEYDASYVTHLHALDPQTGRFHKDALELMGRHCLEVHRGQLRLCDERGRYRNIVGFPLRFENVDWRLGA